MCTSGRSALSNDMRSERPAARVQHFQVARDRSGKRRSHPKCRTQSQTARVGNGVARSSYA